MREGSSVQHRMGSPRRDRMIPGFRRWCSKASSGPWGCPRGRDAAAVSRPHSSYEKKPSGVGRRHLSSLTAQRGSRTRGFQPAARKPPAPRRRAARIGGRLSANSKICFAPDADTPRGQRG
jgi:hypothetical protein